jgi:hypothetical protein
MYKHSAKFERSVLKTVGELAIAAQTMYRNGVCHDFSVLEAGRDTGTTILVLPVSSSICNTGTDTGKY